MTRLRFMLVVVGLWVGITAGCRSTEEAARPSAVPDTGLAGGELVARFEDARAVGVDPAGMLYVADAGPDAVVHLSPGGGDLETLGGPGGETGEFDEPADVDPTNGQVIVVADAGNSRIQRFSREFLHLETLPVGKGYGAAGEEPARPIYDTSADDAGDLGGGRPIAVVEVGADETFAIDAAEGHVVKWEDGRRSVRVIGGFSETDGALREPVDLAVGPDGTLYVADRGRAAVLTYDRFGSFIGQRARGQAEGARAVAVGAQGRLYLGRTGALLVYDRTGRRIGAYRLPLDAPLVDVAPFEETLYVLTSKALYRFPKPH